LDLDASTQLLQHVTDHEQADAGAIASAPGRMRQIGSVSATVVPSL
jgi:hypothetical protein